jgi:uncharacterized protein
MHFKNILKYFPAAVIFRSVIVIFGFLLLFYLADVFTFIYSDWKTLLPRHRFLSNLIWFSLRIGLIFLITPLLIKGNVLHALGLDRRFLHGIALAFVFTLPMLLGPLLFYGFNSNISFYDIWLYGIHAAFWEELLIRSFLFGLLFRYLRWGFIPAALLAAVFFGLGHIYQGGNSLSAFMAFFVTAIGSLWYSWLYIEWRNNAAINIGLHLFMNLSWGIYDIQGGAAGELWPNVFRAVTIALSIIYTVKLISKKHGFAVNKNVLWVHLNTLAPYQTNTITP